MIGILGTLLASQAVGLPTAGLTQTLRNIDWDAITVQPSGTISHGFRDNKELLQSSWDYFGGETLLMAIAQASATGELPVIPHIDLANLHSFNGSGFIDDLLWIFVPLVSTDAYGATWGDYRVDAVNAQVAHYDDAAVPIFGASAVEPPIPTQFPVRPGHSVSIPDVRYGIGGAVPADDGFNIFGGRVAAPHYAGMAWPIAPAVSERMWDYLVDANIATPLNNVESIVVTQWGDDLATNWHSFKGSWNLALQSLGVGNFLTGAANPLHAAARENEFISAGLDLISEHAWGNSSGQKGASPDDSGADIAIDKNGNSIVVGSRFFTGDPAATPGAADIFVAKYSNTGQLLWEHQLGAAGDDRGIAVDVDSSGSIYVTGRFSETVDFDPGLGAPLASAGSYDAFLLKLNPKGDFVWAHGLGQSSGAWDFGSDLTVDDSDNILITGRFSNTVDFATGAESVLLTAQGDGDTFVAKYDAEANLLWARAIGGSSTNFEGPGAVATDSNGTVYVGGRFAGTVDFDPTTNQPNNVDVRVSQGTGDAYIAAYENDGSFRWVTQMGGPFGAFETLSGIDVAPNGNINAVGIFQGDSFDPGDGQSTWSGNGAFDLFVTQLNSQGEFVWAAQVGGSGEERARGIDTNAAGNIVVAGYFNASVDFNPAADAASLLRSNGERTGLSLNLRRMANLSGQANRAESRTMPPARSSLHLMAQFTRPGILAKRLRSTPERILCP